METRRRVLMLLAGVAGHLPFRRAVGAEDLAPWPCGGKPKYGSAGACRTDADCNAGCQCGPMGFARWKCKKKPKGRGKNGHKRELKNDYVHGLLCQPIPEPVQADPEAISS